MPGKDLAELRLIWQRAGRPGAAKLKDAAKRQGINLTVKEVKEFIVGQAASQVFQPSPRSEGRVTSPELNARWQADLMDYKARSPEKNDGYRLVLICIDIFPGLCTSSHSKPRSKWRSPRPFSESREQLVEGWRARSVSFPAT